MFLCKKSYYGLYIIYISDQEKDSISKKSLDHFYKIYIYSKLLF